MAIAALPEGTLLGRGRYRLGGVLARSNFSVTYHARDLSEGGAEVVVKEHACSDACFRDTARWEVLPHPGQERVHRQLIERATREATLLGKVRHPHVVRVDGAWEERGTAYCAMELVPGRTLEDDVAAAPELPLAGPRWRRIRKIALEVLGALEAAHARGVYHCDLKPENVLVSPDRGAVLIDFGAARTEEQLLRTVTLMPFTPGYAPPELLAADRIREVGPWTDAYSWGMLVFGLVAGHPGRGVPVDASRRMLRRSWPAIADRDPYEDAADALLDRGVPEAWAAAIQACLRLDPTDRPASMAELGARLAAAGEEATPAAVAVSAAVPVSVPAPVSAPVPAPVSAPVSASVSAPVSVSAPAPASARASVPSLTELNPELASPPPAGPLPPTIPPPADAPEPPSFLPPAPRPPSDRAHRTGRAPLIVAAAALLLGGALGVALHRDRGAPSAPTAAFLPPPEVVVADEPAPASQETSEAPPAAAACAEGELQCGGACQRSDDPAFGCGRCEPPCKLPHVKEHACQGPLCAPKQCEPGFADCDRNPQNGCEASVLASASSCGACGHDCRRDPTVEDADCVRGACRIKACKPGLRDCDGSPQNGCEANTRTSLEHCGGCNRRCAPVPRDGISQVACATGVCEIAACTRDRAACGGTPENGCRCQTFAFPPNPFPGDPGG